MRSGNERPVRHKGRRRLLLAGWLLSGLAIVGRSAMVQLFQGEYWRGKASEQHRATLEVPAPRGSILDRNENPLATTHETFEVGVAPGEIREGERARVLGLLKDELDLSRAKLQAISNGSRSWVAIPGRYTAQVRERLGEIQGVYFTRELERFYPHPTLAKGVLGAVLDGAGRGGIEGAFDDRLRGVAGREVRARDSEGNPIPGQSILVAPPVPGGEVVLTLDRDLQEIGHEALMAAIEETGAKGGDLVISDPKTGEILALVSLQEHNLSALSAINAPYEPGSTLKPFTVAGILVHGAASLSDTVDGELGRWRVGGRTLTDVHPYGRISVAEALKVSSNVGVAKAAQGLLPSQQYQILRDFGFGTPTGIEVAGEASGTLRRPAEWSRPSPSALAIGYEINVTPLQMVMAYGALANGGWLMEPVLVREVRDSQGQTVYRSGPRTVRRVIPTSVARDITEVLVGVVEEGTGTQAQLATFTVAGKSGTSRAYGPNGYERGAYYASFVCFFPVEDPQLVIYVKLERPEGSYYGGSTAAPVTRATMEAVLAARQAPIDREALASLTRQQPKTSPIAGAQFASSISSPPPPVRAPGTPNQPETGAKVPDVSGLSPRLAVRRLHALGFRVILDAPGSVSRTIPARGTLLMPGDTVRVLTRRRGG